MLKKRVYQGISNTDTINLFDSDFICLQLVKEWVIVR